MVTCPCCAMDQNDALFFKFGYVSPSSLSAERQISVKEMENYSGT